MNRKQIKQQSIGARPTYETPRNPAMPWLMAQEVDYNDDPDDTTFARNWYACRGQVEPMPNSASPAAVRSKCTMSIASASLRQAEPIVRPRKVTRKSVKPTPAARTITLIVTRPSIQDQIAAKLREIEALHALEKVEIQRYKAEYEIASTNAERGTVDIRIVNDPGAIARTLQSNGGQSFFACGSQYYRVSAYLLRRIGLDDRFLLIESAK